MTESTNVVLARIDENVKFLRQAKEDHETRIRSLEKTSHKRQGVVSILTVAFSGVISYFVKGGN